MALLGHTMVETGLARLAGLWPQSPRANRLRLRQSSLPKSDRDALNAATSLYCGERVLTAEDFSDLNWLPQFAGSGRQLLMCHALSLLEGWNEQRHIKRNLQYESVVLLRLARSAGAFAATLDEGVIEPLCLALQSSIKRLLAIRCHDPNELLTKAITLIEVSRAIEDSASLTKEASRILNQALPVLIAVDGGPTRHNLQDFVRWTALLLDTDDLQLHPNSRHALDRARPFLSMLVQHNLAYCFNPAEKLHAAILATTPMHLAPVSGVVRLSARKSVAISVPQHLGTMALLHLSSHNHWLMSAGHFLHDASESHEQQFLSSNNSDVGALLQQVTETTERTVFMSPKGDDIRIEDIVAQDGLTRWMSLKMNPEAKFSCARNGTTATLALDGRNLWQLTVRGAKLIPTTDLGTVLIETTTPNGRVNWALKRISRHPLRNSKSESLELPF